MPTIEEVSSSSSSSPSTTSEERKETKEAEPLPSLNMKAISQISYVQQLVKECGEGSATLRAFPWRANINTSSVIFWTLYNVEKENICKYLLHFIIKDENESVICEERFSHDDLCTRNAMPFCFDLATINKVMSSSPTFREMDSNVIVIFGPAKFVLNKQPGKTLIKK